MNRIGMKVAALVVLLVLSCSAMASTNRVCGYRWGDWQRVDNFEGSVTGLTVSMAMGARNGKMGIATATALTGKIGITGAFTPSTPTTREAMAHCA